MENCSGIYPRYLEEFEYNFESRHNQGIHIINTLIRLITSTLDLEVHSTHSTNRRIYCGQGKHLFRASFIGSRPLMLNKRAW